GRADSGEADGRAGAHAAGVARGSDARAEDAARTAPRRDEGEARAVQVAPRRSADRTAVTLKRATADSSRRTSPPPLNFETGLAAPRTRYGASYTVSGA